MAEETGWAGKWLPNIVSESCLEELRERAGEPVMGRSGKPLQMCVVNLKDGTFTYPASGGR